MASPSGQKLTPKQKEILGQIRVFHQREGYYPSIRELNSVLRIKSSNTTFSHLRGLLKKGFIKKNVRGKIIGCLEQSGRPGIPYFPSGVPAGFAAPAEDAGREMLAVDEYLIKNPQNTFALGVKGNSMEKAGILPNDLLLVEKRSDARPGQIVVARLPGGFTVKRLVEEEGRPCLKAESSKEYLIRLEEGTEIWGIVIGIIRRY